MLITPHPNNSRAWRTAKYISICLKSPSPPSSSSPLTVLFMMFCVGQGPSGLKVFLLGTNSSLYPAVEYIDAYTQRSLPVISFFNATGSAEKCFLFHMPRHSKNPATENLVLDGAQGRPSFNIYKVQSRMEIRHGWVDGYGQQHDNQRCQPVRWFTSEKRFKQTLQGIIASISSAATSRGGRIFSCIMIFS